MKVVLAGLLSLLPVCAKAQTTAPAEHELRAAWSLCLLHHYHSRGATPEWMDSGASGAACAKIYAALRLAITANQATRDTAKAQKSDADKAHITGITNRLPQ